MDNLALSQGGNFAFTSGAFATAAGNVNITNASTITYTINGQFYSRTSVASQSIAMTVPAVASNGYATNGSFTGQTGGSTRLYGIYLDTAGAYSFFPGPIVNSAELAAGTAPLQFPANIKDRACVGCIRIALTAGTTFVPGTTALNAAGVTASYLNLSSIPGSPLLS